MTVLNQRYENMLDVIGTTVKENDKTLAYVKCNNHECSCGKTLKTNDCFHINTIAVLDKVLHVYECMHCNNNFTKRG